MSTRPMECGYCNTDHPSAQACPKPKPAKNTNNEALAGFRAKARRMKPTKEHRAGLWENMLGTVYAMNKDGEVHYFDYNWAEAIAFIGPVCDVRTAKFDRYTMRSGAKDSQGTYTMPRQGQVVWFVKDVEGE